MSINSDSQTKASITEGDRALDLFTDRYSFTRLLAERIHQPPSEQILFFHGAGGNGKSLLLKYLQQNICKRLTAGQWQQAKGLPDAELAAQLEELRAGQYLDVPTVLLDFGLPPLDEVQPKDRFYGLLLLRKALGEAVAGNYRLRFGRYDFACIWYLHRKGKSLDEIRALFPLNEVAGLATTTLDAMTGNPIGAFVKAALDFGVEDWSERLTLLFARQGVDQETQQRIRGLDVDRALIDVLPTLFAEDLNASMAAPKEKAPERLVLLFDTHEAFWGAQRDLPPETYFLRDEWLRRLLRELDLVRGIVVVVAGRDAPRWAEAKTVRPGTEISGGYVQVEEVGLLAAGDARAYLLKVGIEAGDLCEGLITFASVNPQDGPDERPDERQVHPLHLGLCADVVLAAAGQGKALAAGDFAEVPGFDEKGKLLIGRLLKYVSEGLGYAIHGLSACRAFDRSIYFHLGKALNFEANEPTFRQLIRFSFVWQARQRGEEWYRVHDLMRRLDDAPEVRRSHEVLAEYYQAQSSLEAIYHINQLNWSQGIDLWVQEFDRALELSRYEICGTLLDIRRELTIETPFKLGLVSDAEGQYFQNLAQYGAAQQEYREAIIAYDKNLESDPENIATLNNKGNALSKLADLQAALSQYQLAQQSYQAAIAAFDDALKRAPDDVYALNNKGNALQRLADLQAALSQHQLSQQSYQDSIAAFDDALKHAPGYVGALNNKGNSLIKLGQWQAIQSLEAEAVNSFQIALELFEKSLAIAPNNTSIRQLYDQLTQSLNNLDS